MNPQFLLLAFMVLIAVYLFFVIRRQKKQVSTLQDMQESLQLGSKVMTTSGLHGTIVALEETTVELEIAPGVTTTWLRLAIREVLTQEELGDDNLGDDNLGHTDGQSIDLNKNVGDA